MILTSENTSVENLVSRHSPVRNEAFQPCRGIFEVTCLKTLNYQKNKNLWARFPALPLFMNENRNLLCKVLQNHVQEYTEAEGIK